MEFHRRYKNEIVLVVKHALRNLASFFFVGWMIIFTEFRQNHCHSKMIPCGIRPINSWSCKIVKGPSF
jgi:hypothetical protein